MPLPAYLYGAYQIFRKRVCRHVGMIHSKDIKDQMSCSIYQIGKIWKQESGYFPLTLLIPAFLSVFLPCPLASDGHDSPFRDFPI